MALSLYDALIPSWLRIIDAADVLIDKGEAWAQEAGHSPSGVIEARLADDMLPFSYQIKSMWTHSAHAIARVQEGHFEPENTPPPESFQGLHDILGRARTELKALDPGLLDSIAGNDVLFSVGEKIRMHFTVQNFLLSFSQPNFYFHATTAYDILRSEGVRLGKLDYLGALPVNS